MGFASQKYGGGNRKPRRPYRFGSKSADGARVEETDRFDHSYRDSGTLDTKSKLPPTTMEKFSSIFYKLLSCLIIAVGLIIFAVIVSSFLE